MSYLLINKYPGFLIIKLIPAYNRNATTTTLLSQPNTILVGALPGLFEGQLRRYRLKVRLQRLAVWLAHSDIIYEVERPQPQPLDEE